MQIHPYLNFNGETEAAMNFYKSVFGGEFSSVQRFSDMPGSDQMPEGERHKIMHMSLPVGQGVYLMASDTLEYQGHPKAEGNNFSLTIYPDSKAQADQLFAALSAGGTVDMPMEDTFWGAYFGMLTDQFGIKWMFNYETPK